MYRELCLKSRCREHVIDDLAKYYTALTVAIANFHTERMTVINKIIRELWKSTYKGNDIDYIEIFTDGGSDAVANADKRNVANYKVGVRFPGLTFRPFSRRFSPAS